MPFASQESNVRVEPLSTPTLRSIEYRFARAHLRTRWWKVASHLHVDEARPRPPATSLRAGAVGSFMYAMLEERRSRSRLNPRISPVRQADLAGFAIGLAESKLSHLLKGQVAGDDPFTDEVAGRMLRYILLGTSEARLSRCADPEAVEIAERIVQFFFPEGTEFPRYTSGGFFDEQYRYRDMCSRSVEAISEIYALAYATDPRLGDPEDPAQLAPASDRAGRARIVRVSGSRRFVQVSKPENGELTASGHATIFAIRAGVDVSFVYPNESDASRSAECFGKHAAKAFGCRHWKGVPGLHLIPTSRSKVYKSPRGITYYASDFMTRQLRWIFQHAHPRPGCGADWNTLIISREPHTGLCAWDPSLEERTEFADWVDCVTGAHRRG